MSPGKDVDWLVTKYLDRVPERNRELVSDWILQKRAQERARKVYRFNTTDELKVVNGKPKKT